jgi:hypothetical protein
MTLLIAILSELDLQKKHVDAFDKMMAQSPGCLEVVREFYAAEDATHWTQLVKLVRRLLSYLACIYIRPV